MKKLICLILSLVCLLGMLVSCIPTSDSESEPVPEPEPLTPAKQVIKQIEELPNPHSATEEYGIFPELAEALKSYDALSEEEKKEITNYDRLLYANEIRQYHQMLYKIQPKMESSIKSKLLNPSSMIVNSHFISLCKVGDTFYASGFIDYSAQNRAGGYARDTEYFYYKSNSPESKTATCYPISISFEEYQKATKGAEVYGFPSWN